MLRSLLGTNPRCLWASTHTAAWGGGAQLVNEMLQGIRAIKFYNWETPFRERVEAIHDEELGILRRSTTLRSLVVSVLTTTPAIVIVITLGLYRWGGVFFADTYSIMLLCGGFTPYELPYVRDSASAVCLCMSVFVCVFFFVFMFPCFMRIVYWYDFFASDPAAVMHKYLAAFGPATTFSEPPPPSPRARPSPRHASPG